MFETDFDPLLLIFTSALDFSTKVAVEGVGTNTFAVGLFSSCSPFVLFC